MSGVLPDTSASYERAAALPFAQPPAGLRSYTLGQWFSGAKLRVDPLVWKAFDEDGQDPGVPGGEVRLRSVAINATEGLLVPRDIAARVYGAANTQGAALPAIAFTDWKRLWSAVAYERLSMKKGESEAAFAARTAGLLAWDDAASKASPMSIPLHTDGSLIAAWGSPLVTTSLPALDTDLAGALGRTAPDGSYLLATPKQGTEGELDPRLLRAPAPGIFRFERYQHVVRKSTGDLVLRRPSHDGRIVVLTTPPTMLGGLDADAFDDIADLDQPLRLVFEDVAASSLPFLLPPLFADQLRRFGSLLDSMPFTQDAAGMRKYLVDVVGWLLRTWQAAAALAPAVASVPASIAERLAAKVPLGESRDPHEDALREAAALVAADATAWTALVAYLDAVFVRLMLGERWSDVGVPVDPAGALAGSAAAKDAIDFARRCERWIPCFAGCALGRTGITWVLNDAMASVFDAASGRFRDAGLAHRNAYSTFEVEALYQARVGGAGETIADHATARAAGLIGEFDLMHYGDDVLRGTRCGWIGVLRLVETSPPKRGYTTVDWIREVVRGTVRRRYQEALLDYALYGSAQGTPHPLSALVEWDLYAKARVLRDRLDRLNVAAAGTGTLHAATVNWWRDNTHLADAAGKWTASFSSTVGGVTAAHRIKPGPDSCYLAAGLAQSGRDRAVTRGRQLVRLSKFAAAPPIIWDIQGGWDDFDLVAVQKAARAVRDGRTLVGPIHPALVMAVADIEGYRVFMGENRIRSAAFEQVLGPATAALAASSRPGGSNRQAFTDALARALWQVWTFGLDLWNHPRSGLAPSIATADFPETSAAHINWVLNRLTHVDWHGQPRDVPAGAVDPSRSLIDVAVFPPSGDLPRFAAARLSSLWTTVGGLAVARFSRVTRELEWVGLTMQAATFQWVHRQLSEMTAYLAADDIYQRVDEIVDAALPPPAPGAAATSLERRNYIAYWATVYLAFNASPGIWNSWISRARSGKAAAERLSNFLLYKLDNSAANPPAMSADAATSVGAIGQMMRFALALDAYLRLDFTVDLTAANPAGTGVDASSPQDRRGWEGVP